MLGRARIEFDDGRCGCDLRYFMLGLDTTQVPLLRRQWLVYINLAIQDEHKHSANNARITVHISRDSTSLRSCDWLHGPGLHISGSVEDGKEDAVTTAAIQEWLQRDLNHTRSTPHKHWKPASQNTTNMSPRKIMPSNNELSSTSSSLSETSLPHWQSLATRQVRGSFDTFIGVSHFIMARAARFRLLM